jgi:quercetin dioxygenase-like cupin family protein
VEWAAAAARRSVGPTADDSSEAAMISNTGTARVLGPDDGDLLGPEGAQDRFMVGGADSGGRLAVVEHRLAPRVLAAPLHRHTREDEWSFVLEGRVGALLGDEELVAEAGHFVVKPRDQWHTFWNAGDEPARVLELISPAGLEELFRTLDTLAEGPAPALMAEMAAAYGAQVDFEGTGPVIGRHGLIF